MAKASTEFTYRRLGPTGSNFTQSEFRFVERPLAMLCPLSVVEVDTTSGINALRFSKDGVDVELPLMAFVVRLKVWTGAGPIKIEVFDEDGVVIGSRTDGGIEAFVDTAIRAHGITTVRVTEGNNEASLEIISIEGN